MKTRLLKTQPIKTLPLIALTAALLAGTGSAAQLTHWEHQYAQRVTVIKDMIGDYKTKTGDVVNFESIPLDSYFDKLTTALSSGTGPDVMKVPSTMMYQLIRAKLIAPAPRNVMTAQLARTAYLDWVIAPNITDNQIYGLPTDVQTIVMFINNDLLKACGGNPAKPPKTWAEFEKVAKACTIRDASGKLTQAGADTRYKWGTYTTFLYQGTKGQVDNRAQLSALWGDADGVGAWNYMSRVFGGPTGIDSPAFMSGQFKFELGKAVFYFNHPVTRARLSSMSPDLKYTIALPPTPDGKPKTVVSNWVYVVNAKSKNVDAAWKWVKNLTDESAQRKWSAGAGDLPSLRKLQSDNALFPDANAKVIQQSLRSVFTPQELGKAEVDDIRQAVWDRLALQGGDMSAAVKQQAEAETRFMKSLK
jgi:multiple sugar transport system substrate-binding protein